MASIRGCVSSRPLSPCPVVNPQRGRYTRAPVHFRRGCACARLAPCCGSSAGSPLIVSCARSQRHAASRLSVLAANESPSDDFFSRVKSQLYLACYRRRRPVCTLMTKEMLTNCCALLADALSHSAKRDWGATAHMLKLFLGCFSKLSSGGQDAIRDLLTDTEARMIASLSVTAAASAISERSVDWLQWSLLAHDVEQFREEPRNNLRLLAVTNYAAEVFDRAASVMSERSAKYIREFARRPRERRTLRTMGVRATSEAGHTRFEFL
jgi:hypothetical protein